VLLLLELLPPPTLFPGFGLKLNPGIIGGGPPGGPFEGLGRILDL